jgi:hypothetical protein
VRTATVFSGGRSLDYAVVQLIKLFTPGAETDPVSSDRNSRIDALVKIPTDLPEGIPTRPREPISQFQELKRLIEAKILQSSLERQAKEKPQQELAEVISCAQFCLSARQPIKSFEELKRQRNREQPPPRTPLWSLHSVNQRLQADQEIRDAEENLRKATDPQAKLDAMCRLHEARQNPGRTKPHRLEPSVKQLKLEMDKERKEQTSQGSCPPLESVPDQLSQF